MDLSSSLDRNGSLQAQSKDFEEHIDIHDLSDQPTSQTTDFLEMERLRKALAMGVRDYVLKSGFSKVVIGLSGGIDSAVTAAIAVDALGAQNVLESVFLHLFPVNIANKMPGNLQKIWESNSIQFPYKV